MSTHHELKVLDERGMRNFVRLQSQAVSAVAARLEAAQDTSGESLDGRGQMDCREDLTFHLEFLRPVLEFGLIQPMVDYLRWFSSVQRSRGAPSGYLIQSLGWLAQYFSEAMGTTDGEVVAAAIGAAQERFLKAGCDSMVAPRPPGVWPQAAAFEAALLAGKQREAMEIVNTCLDSGEGLVQFELHVIQPALYAIGEKWQSNQVSVAQEHMATAIVESVMTAALLRSPPPLTIDKRVLLACVEGNNHSIGLRMVADAFLLSGWDVQYLGANVPTRSLVQQVADWNPDLVGLSVCFPQQLGVVKRVIGGITECLGQERPAVIVGGLVINRLNQLVDAVGADAWGNDAREAVDSASQILGNRLPGVAR
jgi:methanogenic corrinoid protein MtbC1